MGFGCTSAPLLTLVRCTSNGFASTSVEVLADCEVVQAVCELVHTVLNRTSIEYSSHLFLVPHRYRQFCISKSSVSFRVRVTTDVATFMCAVPCHDVPPHFASSSSSS